MSRAGERAARYRRRRLGALIGLALVPAAGGGLLALGSGSDPGRSGVGGVGPSLILDPARAYSPPAARPAQFRPAPGVSAMVARLPLERLVAQLFVVGLPPGGAPLHGPGWGGLLFTRADFSSDSAAAALLSAAKAAVRVPGAPAPLLVADQAGGDASALPDLQPPGEAQTAASGTPGAARAAAATAGRSLHRLGFGMTLAPQADTDVTGGAFSGLLFGADPGLVARYSDQAVAGYRQSGMISAPGHFPGQGSASGDPNQMTATVGGPLAALSGRDLIPFAALVRSAPVIQMSNAVYAAFDGVTPASLLPAAVALLRDRLGYAGVVLSGDLDAALQATGGGIGAAAVAALDAGDDLLLLTGSSQEELAAYRAVLRTVRSGGAERRRVVQAALRVLSLKARFGLLH